MAKSVERLIARCAQSSAVVSQRVSLMGSDARNAAARAGSTGGYRRRFGESELLLPQPHALKPGIGLLKAPAVIALENVGDGEHQVERAFVVAAAGAGTALQGVGELEEVELREPVALFKGSKGVVLLEGRDRELIS